MNVAGAAVRGLREFSPKHASVEEYAAFVRRYLPNKGSHKRPMTWRDQFVRRYPDLQEWFRAPLTERMGRLYGEPTAALTKPTSYWGRPYLCFLALRGYAQLDWE
jgi:hypothetical protein